MGVIGEERFAYRELGAIKSNICPEMVGKYFKI
jgi:hypothetical protein